MHFISYSSSSVIKSTASNSFKKNEEPFNLLNGRDCNGVELERDEWTGDDQNRFESRAVDLNGKEWFQFIKRSRVKLNRSDLILIDCNRGERRVKDWFKFLSGKYWI